MMDWKKWISLGIIAGSFLAWGSLTPLWAGEADIIDMLKAKNIITQEEADRMMDKVNATSRKEKTDIKKEIKTEVKEDIMKDAAKGEFLPSALKGFKFGTTIYADWASKSNFSGNNANTNAFELNRAYATLTKDFNDYLSMNFTADLFTSKDNNDVGNGLELRVKYAYANVKLFGTETMLGMVPTPSDAYDNSIWPYRVQGKNLLDDLGIQASADLGIVNQGVFGGYMDNEYLKYASKPFAGKWGGYMIGLFNGSGYDTPENNNNKVVSGLIYLRPLPTLPILNGFQLAYIGTYGLSNNNFAAGQGSPTTDYPAWQTNVGQVSLQHSYFSIMGQYYWGKGTKSASEEKDRKGYLASAFVRAPGLEKLRAFGKYYSYDPDTNSTNKDYAVYVAGLSYDISKELMPFISWERGDNHVNAGRIDYNKFQIGFQLKL